MNTLENYGLSDRFKNEATMYKDLKLARVITQYKNIYKIATEQGEMLAEVSGKFKYETEEPSHFPVVGDYVMVNYNNLEDRAIIQHVLTRKSVFWRKAVGKSTSSQIVATNIDILFICMSLNNNYNLNRLERYLSIAYESMSKPVIILTKADLCSDLEEKIAEVEEVSFYCDVIATSVYNPLDEKLINYLNGKNTVAFVGSSGVGKSTLINKILGEQIIKTKDVSYEDRGTHTTTNKAMYITPYGSILIDTPGMKELGVENIDISNTFDDIEELAAQCKFNDCSHTSEPGCAVLNALENGALDKRRYENFIKLQNESSYDGLNSREIEHKKLDRMFKDFGGMKSAKKALKKNKNLKY